MTWNPTADVGEYRRREDGQWRSDQAQEAHEHEQEQGRKDREMAEATAKRCASDPLLKRLDSHLRRGGIENWNERYLIIAAIDDLWARHVAALSETPHEQ